MVVFQPVVLFAFGITLQAEAVRVIFFVKFWRVVMIVCMHSFVGKLICCGDYAYECVIFFHFFRARRLVLLWFKGFGVFVWIFLACVSIYIYE